MTLSAGTPGIPRRLASMLYEALLLAAVLFLAGFIFIAVFHPPLSPVLHTIFQLYLLLATAIYFIWLWRHGGQTLPMKTWRLRLVGAGNQPVTLKQACLRFACAVIGIPLVFGILWALFDRDRQFWHDRMAGTKIVLSTIFSPPATSSPLRQQGRPASGKWR